MNTHNSMTHKFTGLSQMYSYNSKLYFHFPWGISIMSQKYLLACGKNRVSYYHHCLHHTYQLCFTATEKIHQQELLLSWCLESCLLPCCKLIGCPVLWALVLKATPIHQLAAYSFHNDYLHCFLTLLGRTTPLSRLQLGIFPEGMALGPKTRKKAGKLSAELVTLLLTSQVLLFPSND